MRYNKVLITGASGFIGTNLAAHYLEKGAAVMNFDTAPPRNPEQRGLWRRGDVTDIESVSSAVAEFQPDLVLHAAARTDLGGSTVDDYPANTVGAKNIVEIASRSSFVRRVINFSSLLVCRLGYRPRHDEDYQPNTAYGESKVAGERVFRALKDAPFEWANVRPTSIWGPWFGSPYRSFFEIVRAGLYVHPKGAKSLRNYGYVENTVLQIAAIAETDSALTNRGTFYVGDYDAIDVRNWANCISLHCGRGPVRELPPFVFKVAGFAGDVLKTVGYRNPPFSSQRLSNLLTKAIYDLSATKAVCPSLPFDMENGVVRTLKWLERQGRGT